MSKLWGRKKSNKQDRWIDDLTLLGKVENVNKGPRYSGYPQRSAETTRASTTASPHYRAQPYVCTLTATQLITRREKVAWQITQLQNKTFTFTILLQIYSLRLTTLGKPPLTQWRTFLLHSSGVSWDWYKSRSFVGAWEHRHPYEHQHRRT